MLIKTASETDVGGLDGLEISRWEYRAAYIVLPKAATATTIRFILTAVRVSGIHNTDSTEVKKSTMISVAPNICL